MNTKLKNIITAATLITGIVTAGAIYADANGHGGQGTGATSGSMMGGNMMNAGKMGDPTNMPGAGQMGQAGKMGNFDQMEGFSQMQNADGMKGRMKMVATMMQEHGQDMQAMLEADDANTGITE